MPQDKKQRKKRLEQRINAIVERHMGVPYPEVLEGHGLTPSQFCSAVRDLPYLLSLAPENAKPVLEEILADDKIMAELFRMGEGLILSQYLKVMRKKPEEKERKLYDGVFAHPENQQLLIYVALTLDRQQLASTDRATVVNGVNSLPPALTNYFRRIKLGGLVAALGGSPWAVLKAYDAAYQAKTGNASLFDLSQPVHLHEWGGKFHTPREYWQNLSNVETAVYHVLTENSPLLGSAKREEVILGIQNLPSCLHEYLASLGLESLMVSAFGKGERASPVAVMKVFDNAYQRNTGDVSLFDKAQRQHLDVGARNRLIAKAA